MLLSISLQNFKAFGPQEVTIPLRPLTVLVGPNGSGKSSLLTALGLIAQSTSDPHRGGFSLGGEFLVTEAIDTLFHRRDTQRPLRIAFTVRPERMGIVPWWNPHPQSATLSYVVEHARKGPAAAPEEEWLQEVDFDGAWTIRVSQNRSQRTLGLRSPGGGPTASLSPYDVDRILGRTTFSQAGSPLTPELSALLARIGTTVDELRAALRGRLSLLSDTRSAAFFVKEVGPTSLSTGRFGERAVRVLSAMVADVEQRGAIERIRHWGAQFGLANLVAGWVGQNELRMNFADPQTGTALPVDLAGGGSQHLLPFLIDCFASRTPRVLLVDELEHGLHPEWVVKVAELLAEVVSRGNQVVVCTQSPTLALAVSAIVAEGKLRAEAVALHSFGRSPEGGVEAKLIELSESGALQDGWIEHFARVESDLLRRFLPPAG
jgi:ABC-type cobalamin/Fe3+-siderophores transport system ATPase subunit